MDQRRDNQPDDRPQVPPFDKVQQREQNRRRGERPRIQVRIENKKCRTCDRNRQRRRNQQYGAPTGSGSGETVRSDSPTRQQQQENRQQMPNQNRIVEGKMRDPHRCRDQAREQRPTGMRGKKLVVKRIERRTQQLLNSGQVNGRIFGCRVVAMHEERRDRRSRQQTQISQRSLRRYFLLHRDNVRQRYPPDRTSATFGV